MSTYGVALFHTNSAVMRAEKVLAQAGMSIKLVPTPRQFSSDCGIAVRFAWDEVERVNELLGRANVEVASIRSMS